MAKLVASVTRVLRPGIHKSGSVREGELQAEGDFPLPDRVEIEMDGGRRDPCMMYRYRDDGAFCGDTWHETLDAAFDAAESEYGLTEDDFSPAEP